RQLRLRAQKRGRPRRRGLSHASVGPAKLVQLPRKIPPAPWRQSPQLRVPQIAIGCRLAQTVAAVAGSARCSEPDPAPSHEPAKSTGAGRKGEGKYRRKEAGGGRGRFGAGRRERRERMPIPTKWELWARMADRAEAPRVTNWASKGVVFQKRMPTPIR